MKLNDATPEHKALVVSNDETIEEYRRMITNMDEKTPIIHQIDTSFNFNGCYLTTLSYRHDYLVRTKTIGDGTATAPTIPLFSYVTQRKSAVELDHAFYRINRTLQACIPTWEQHPKILISDREFKEDYMPNTEHFYCWNHICQNVEFHARNSLKMNEDDRRRVNNDL